LPFLQYCSKAVKSLIVKISGTNHVLGHQLWAKIFPKPTETSKHKFIIVGAGISGLSAARILKKWN
jgi:ribulose 1,5-bisphosphate synthetase/thiazole synthase